MSETALGAVEGQYTVAAGISDAGVIVGHTTGPIEKALLWKNGVMHDMASLGAPDAFGAYGISPGGRVVGEMSGHGTGPDAFLWVNGVMQDLHTTWWSRKDLQQFMKQYDPPHNGAVGLAANDRGQVVGECGESPHGDSPDRAFLWSHGVMRDLGTLPPPGGGDSFAMKSWATAINDLGLVVGWSELGNLPGHAFLYSEASGMVDLNTRIDPTLRWELREANGINNRGQIVGSGFGHGQQHAVLLTPAPPSLARVWAAKLWRQQRLAARLRRLRRA